MRRTSLALVLVALAAAAWATAAWADLTSYPAPASGPATQTAGQIATNNQTATAAAELDADRAAEHERERPRPEPGHQRAGEPDERVDRARRWPATPT